MNNQSRIEELQSEIQRLQLEQANCGHQWNEAQWDPESHLEASGYRLVGHGSDPYPEATGYHRVDKPRWSRTCKTCGKIQYTYTQEPIVVGKKPKFN